MTDITPAPNSTQPAGAVAADIPCPVCREPIKAGARKCVHCNSALDWRRFLGVSETTLALLVALVTVVAAAGPKLIELFTPNTSDLKLSVRQIFGQNLELNAWNQGHMNSQFESARISAKTKDGNWLEPISLQIIGASNVFAAQQTLFGLQVQPIEIPTFLNWPHTQIESAKLEVVVNEWKRKPEIRVLEVPMDFFRIFCRGTEDADNFSRHPGQTPPTDSRMTSRCVAHPN
jgi:hypothetical protein